MLVKDIKFYNEKRAVYVIKANSYLLQCIDPGKEIKIDSNINMMDVIEISMHKGIIIITVEEVNYVYPDHN